jgi:hypothetical protein
MEDTLREVVEALAPLDRTPCSPGERQAAEWLGERLRAAGCAEVALEEEPSWGTFQPTTLALAAAGILAGALGLAGHRRSGALLGLAAAAGCADEIQNGPRLFRRVLRRERRTVNVVARAGDPEADRTLVVLAHHDAAQTGLFYDQTLQRKVWERFPQVIDGTKTSPPQWWPVIAGPAVAGAGALTGRRRLTMLGMLTCGFTLAIVGDMARSETVPGANDNLSACALIVALAEALRERPVAGLRVLLVSCGAEETLQDGVRAFMARHGSELPVGSTYFLVPDTVGSPSLALLEAEGPLWMETYPGGLCDLVAECAASEGIELERGLRARASTDAIIPARAGHPTAALVSMNAWRNLSNYHLATDTPQNLEFATVVEATRLTEAVAQRLAEPAR